MNPIVAGLMRKQKEDAMYRARAIRMDIAADTGHLNPYLYSAYLSGRAPGEDIAPAQISEEFFIDPEHRNIIPPELMPSASPMIPMQAIMPHPAMIPQEMMPPPPSMVDQAVAATIPPAYAQDPNAMAEMYRQHMMMLQHQHMMQQQMQMQAMLNQPPMTKTSAYLRRLPYF